MSPIVFSIAGAVSLQLALAGVAPGPSARRERVRVQQPDSVTGVLCVVDASSRQTLSGVTIEKRDDGMPQRVSDVARERPRRITVNACVRLAAGRVQVRRIGYQSVVTWVRANSPADTIGLAHALTGASGLDTVRIRDRREDTPVGRVSSVLSVNSAQRAGVASAAQLVSRLPFVATRDARGEQAIQLRGSRSEQVVVLLDGMVMNDPATGRAHVNDLPLSALDAATATLGASPISGGPGALGGIVSLTTALRRSATLRMGTLGQYSAEGSWAVSGIGTQWSVAAAHARAANAFVFLNTAAPVPTEERRVNNDESRSTVTLGAVGDRWQLRSIVSRTDRGMVGPMNVRTYDADRARTDRALLRAQASLGRRALVLGSVRQLSLMYKDPARAELNNSARVWAIDAEATGAFHPSFGAQQSKTTLAWRAGGGTDHLRTSGGLVQGRARAFLAAQAVARGPAHATDFGVRVDAVGGAVQSSFSAAAERRLRASWTVSARAAQAFRAPTLYDLYFSSPQRVSVRALEPERVSSDLELATHTTHRTPLGLLRAHASLSTRETRNAIIWFPGNFGWSPTNVGRERLRGAEFRVQLTPSWGDFALWSTHYDSRVVTGDLAIPTPYTPRASAGASASATVHSVSASLFARAMGRRPFSAGPSNRAFELPAVGIVDVAFSHPLPSALMRRIGDALVVWALDNAFDTAWQSVRGFPSPGRTLAVSVSLRHSPTSP